MVRRSSWARAAAIKGELMGIGGVAAHLFVHEGFARYSGQAYTLIAVNIGDSDQTVPFWLPVDGDYVEELHGGTLDLNAVPQLAQVTLTVPRYYGRVWTAARA
jgi:hypothetical protein